MTAVIAALAAVVGVVAGVVIGRVAGRFPWPAGARLRALVAPGAAAVRSPVLEVGTAVLLALVVLRFGPTWELPAFLALAGGAVLLAVVDLQHQLLPNRILLPSLALGAGLLVVAALGEGAWPSLLRAVLGAATLFVVFLVLALISPSGLGMGDVKLAALVGLYLGWLGWETLLVGAAAGFAVQAVLALVLLAARRVQRSSSLPFGPAMLLGAALAIGLQLA